jgi:hypothetical protein
LLPAFKARGAAAAWIAALFASNATAQSPSDPATSYEQRIAALEARLREMEAQQAAAAEQDELDKLLRAAEAGAPPTVPRPQVNANALNPQISVIPDFTALFKQVSGDDEALVAAFGELFEEGNPFALREVEVDFRAPVSPDADAVAILAVGEEETAFEEAYLDLHDLPWDLRAKVGRFKLGFGRANALHQHDQPTIDRALVHQLVFGPEGTSVDGVSLSRPLYRGEPGGLAPSWTDLTVEVTNAANEESPLFGTEAHQEVAVAGRLKNYWEIDEHSDFEAGVSGLAIGDAPDDERGDSTALGLDLTYRLRDEVPGSFRDWIFQAEVIGSEVNGFADDVSALGGYLLVQRRLDAQRYLGIRLDQAESPTMEGADLFGVTPYFTWYLNEFLRLRLQYQYVEGNTDEGDGHSDSIGLQLTWVFGAHPPEPYWVNK